MNDLVNQFSKHLFWDVDKSKMDFERNKTWLVGRVLQYGLMNDWLLLKKLMGIKEITERAMKLRYLDDVTLNFIATISDIPKEKFRCYQWTRLNNNFEFDSK